jgi:hypothetical protein
MVSMNLRSYIFKTGLKNSVYVKGTAASKDVRDFIFRFNENYEAVDLIRVGGESDGGYLVPDILKEMTYCFSPGVDDKAYFESELADKYGMKSYMADASVSSTPIENKNFIFSKKFIGNRTTGDFITLGDWVTQSVGDAEDSMILQMDIEGSEYDVLIVESEVLLNRFPVMIIEFHFLQNIFERQFLSTITSIFEKIYKTFCICHVHPNNSNDIESLDGIDVPRVIEVTFLKRSFLEKARRMDSVELPHKLDRKNVKSLKDIKMPEMWWKSK